MRWLESHLAAKNGRPTKRLNEDSGLVGVGEGEVGGGGFD